jgi:hypothetical protein
MTLSIREIGAGDFTLVWPLFRAVVAAGPVGWNGNDDMWRTRWPDPVFSLWS